MRHIKNLNIAFLVPILSDGPKDPGLLRFLGTLGIIVGLCVFAVWVARKR